jgi:hypothetical protein
MKDLLVQLNDLPDEILLHIFRKLHNVEVLFYLIDVNQRLNKIVHDPIFTSNLCLLLHYPDRNAIYPLCDPVLDRFCSTILPEIGYQVKTLFLEGTSMNRILHASIYPNLYCLCLYNVEAQVAKSVFAGKRFSSIVLILELIDYLKS